MTRKTALGFVGAIALAVATFAPAAPSYAWDRWHHEGGWHGGHPYHGGGWHGGGGCYGCGAGAAIAGFAAGAAVGAAVGAATAPPPVYYGY